jgi:magnesium-protoporphyrin O-methyltransferase
MDCCGCEGVDILFNRKQANKKLTQYRQKGAQKTTRVLVEALMAEGVTGLTLLDVGGGIGTIQHALLKQNVRHATNVEASKAHLEACQEEATRQGHAERITHVHGDFTEIGDALPPADIVTLERVICCYPHMRELVAQSCAKTGKLLGLVYPRETWWLKLAINLLFNLVFRLTRNPFRVFLHSPREITAVVESHGLARRFQQKVGPWQVVVYGRMA